MFENGHKMILKWQNILPSNSNVQYVFHVFLHNQRDNQYFTSRIVIKKNNAVKQYC